jgi:hypothetical protein
VVAVVVQGVLVLLVQQVVLVVWEYHQPYLALQHSMLEVAAAVHILLALEVLVALVLVEQEHKHPYMPPMAQTLLVQVVVVVDI